LRSRFWAEAGVVSFLRCAHDLAERDQVMLGVTVASASHAAS
jgi:hypothetical protein